MKYLFPKLLTALLFAPTLYGENMYGENMHGETNNTAMKSPPSAEQLIHILGLEKHVEGGYFRRTYQSDGHEKIKTPHGERFAMSSIFYLLVAQSPIGHWHLNKSDIVHYYHLGDPITYYLIHPNGDLESVVMGPNPTKNQQLQLTVKGGTWKASHLTQGEYGLISEAVAPGFEYSDMTLGKRGELLKKFPKHKNVIEQFSQR